MVVDMANRHKVGDARSQCGPEHYYYFKEQGKCNGNKEMYRKIEIFRFSVFFLDLLIFPDFVVSVFCIFLASWKESFLKLL